MRTGVYGIAYWTWKLRSGNAEDADGTSGSGFQGSSPANDPAKPSRE